MEQVFLDYRMSHRRNRLLHERRHAIPPFLTHGRARMLRAPFKSRPSFQKSPAILSTRPAPDLIRDGDTPSLPLFTKGIR